MAGTSGSDLARQLRSRGLTTPIIGIFASRLILAVAAGSGLFDAIMYTPFDLHELIDCFKEAITAHAEPARSIAGR